MLCLVTVAHGKSKGTPGAQSTPGGKNMDPQGWTSVCLGVHEHENVVMYRFNSD